MEGAQLIVKLGPAGVELIDQTMIGLSRDIAMYRPTVERFVKGEPAALLLVEFAGDDGDDNLRRLTQLVELMGALGFPGAVVEAITPGFQSAIRAYHPPRPHIMLSMNDDVKP